MRILKICYHLPECAIWGLIVGLPSLVEDKLLKFRSAGQLLLVERYCVSFSYRRQIFLGGLPEVICPSPLQER